MYDNPAVLIAGAGPTGLTLALDLARRGIPFRLIDAAGAPFAGSRGKGIQPRTLEILDDLGVVDAILAAGGPYPKFRIHLGPLSLRAGSLGSTKPPTERVPYPNLWMLPQSRTEAIMRDRLRTLGGEVEFGTALASFRQDESGVDAILSTGESVRASFLVGSDGGHSGVRKALGLNLEGEAMDEDPVVVADVEIEGLDRQDWHVWPMGKGAPIGICPLPGTPLFQLIARAERIGPDVEKGVERAIGKRVSRVSWSSIYRPAARMVSRFRVGRVFLAGDAAHVHSPVGGQGLNTGVQDAVNLGWKLAQVVEGTSPDSLLDTYHAERHPVAARVLRDTIAQSSLLLPDDRVKTLGDTIAELLSMDEPRRRFGARMSGLDIHYDLGEGHPLLGRRMPDLDLVTANGPLRVFTLLHDARPVLLNLGGSGGFDIAPWAGRVQLIDAEYVGTWELPALGEVAAPTAVLIRPDGYVAWVGDLTEGLGLADSLTTWFGPPTAA
jgi:2-polyprenyl-6-methoxyphenol hydroxylase-like FAD-dependent oxidoreductase